MPRLVPVFLLLALPFGAAPAKAGEINLLTDTGTPFPPGCIALDLPEAPASPDNTLVDSIISAPSVNSDALDTEVNVVIWRVGCPDEDFSVVMVRLEDMSEDRAILVPQAFAQAGQVDDRPNHQAQLIPRPAIGNAGTSGSFQEIPAQGVTYMLAVEPCPLDDCDENTPAEDMFFPEAYNGLFTLELSWEDYSNTEGAFAVFDVFAFDPGLDPPQFDQPVLNGRFSGQWVLEGAPGQGLVLQIAEQVDRNFVFAIFFTYLDGQPIWVVGNSSPTLVQPGSVSIDMETLEQGEFVSDPNQPPPGSLPRSDAGSIEIEVLNCNRLRVNYDFSPLGKGSGSIELDRLIRIAGYDCNPWP